jgi:hypothetical protein
VLGFMRRRSTSTSKMPGSPTLGASDSPTRGATRTASWIKIVNLRP